MKKMKVYRLLTGSELNLSVAQNVINEILNDNQPLPITVEKLLKKWDELIMFLRKIFVLISAAVPFNGPAVAIYIVREITQTSMKQLAKNSGNRDHTTIVYTLKKVQELMKIIPMTRELSKILSKT